MGGAVKQLLESLGLGLAAYRDGAPTSPQGVITAKAPYAVVTEQVALASHPVRGIDHEVDVEVVQVDLWQHARRTDASGVVNVESYTLPEQVRAALIGRALDEFSPWLVWRTTCSVRRWPPSDNLVRHTLTVTVTRNRDRKAA